MKLFEKIFGTHSENELKRIYPIADRIEALEPEMQALTDDELKHKTEEFRNRLAEGETLGDGALVSTRTMRESDDVMVMVAFAERLMVIPENMDEVVEYSAVSQSSDNCWCNINPGKDKETGELYRGIEVNWYPPTTFFDLLLENTEIKLSELQDTIVVSVQFADGDTETVTVDVNADDDGNIYMIYRGAK